LPQTTGNRAFAADFVGDGDPWQGCQSGKLRRLIESARELTHEFLAASVPAATTPHTALAYRKEFPRLSGPIRPVTTANRWRAPAMAPTNRAAAEAALQLACLTPDSALGQRLEAHRAYLTILARMQIGRRLQGKAEAADVVQETFLHAVRDFAQFRGTSDQELAAWLRQILAARLADLFRRFCGTQGRDVRLEQSLQVEIDQSSQGFDRGLVAPLTSPSQQAARHEQVTWLAQALEGLPADYREVLVLRHLEECEFPEVARRMDRSVEAVKKLWARALARLRQSVGDAP
jgi:RNA polymerase sigma-70 factor (ECF subfamily)